MGQIGSRLGLVSRLPSPRRGAASLNPRFDEEGLTWRHGANARPGWPSRSWIGELRDAWLDASDVAARRWIARDMQVQTFQDVPYIPLGVFLQNTAYRNGLPASSKGSRWISVKINELNRGDTSAARSRDQASEEWGKQ